MSFTVKYLGKEQKFNSKVEIKDLIENKDKEEKKEEVEKISEEKI